MRNRLTTFALLSAVLLAPAVALRAEETEAERTARVKSLSAEEKEELAQKRKRFEELGAQEQERVKQLHRAIESRPDKAQLVAVMQNYHEWLKTLSASQLTDLKNLPDDKKVEHIKRLVRDQRQENEWRAWLKIAHEASPEDLETVYNWMRDFVQSHRDSLLRSMPSDFSRRIGAIEDPERQTMVLIHLMQWQRSFPGTLRPSKDDVDELIERLSPDAQRLFNESEFTRRLQLISIWMRTALWSKAFPNVTSEQLAAFFDKLPADERDRLEKMSPQERELELRSAYARANFFRPGELGDRPPWTRDPREPRGNPRDGSRLPR